MQGLQTALSLAQPAGTWSQTYSFDNGWRMTSLTSPAGSFSYGYPASASRLLTSISLPNGAKILNSYDSLARLTGTALNDHWGHTLDGYTYGLDALGLKTNLTRDFGLATSTVKAGYDNISQLTSWTAKETNGTPRLNEQLGWAYDAAGNLDLRTNGALVQSFNVNATNELTNVSRTGAFTLTGATPAPATSVTVNGNTTELYADFTFARTNLLLTDGSNSFTNIAQNTYGLKATNIVTLNLLATVQFGYDDNGNLTNDGLRSLAYDAENQMTNVMVAGAWKSEFVYDGLNRRRISRDFIWNGSGWVKTNEVRLIYDGMLPVQERDSNNVPLVTYTRGLDLSGTLAGAGGIGGLLARTDTNGSAFYHADGSGNITALMDGRENIVARYLYNPFGKLTGKWGTLADANVMRFSSMPELRPGIVGFALRPYLTEPGRFANQDPIQEAGGLNLYGFVGNNPINNIDPLGLWNLWNPATWGDANPNGWSFGNSLTPWHESSGYTWEGIKETTSEADAAFLDGVIPFADPFKNLYDPCDKSLQWSKRIGEYTRDAELALAGARLAKFRGPEYGRWKDAGQWQKGWHGHFDWGNGLGTHHLPQQTGNFLKNFGAVIKRWWNAP